MIGLQVLATERQIQPRPSVPAWAAWGIGTPRFGGRLRLIFQLLPTQRWLHPSRPGVVWAVSGVGRARWGAVYSSEILLAQRRIQPSPSGPAWAARWIGTPHGGLGMIAPSAPPHTAAETTDSLWSCLRYLGDRDAPLWFLAPPTQRRIHLSPSGPASAVGGIGTP